MRLWKDRILHGDVIMLEMTPDEYGDMCRFMLANGIGYGPGRTLTTKWREAREDFKKRETK
jgi:hypothetical protein